MPFSILPRGALLAGLFLSLSTAPSLSVAGTTCVSLAAAGTAATQDFNTLANSGTTNTVLPAGWYLAESGTSGNNNGAYQGGTGGSNSGDTYSFGATGTAERAFGGLRSGTLVPTIGACFLNNTGVTITSLGVAYTGEHWRLGTAARNDQLDFQISTDATSLVTGTYTDVNSLDFVTPTNTGTAGARDGNIDPNRTAVAANIPSLSIPAGAVFWIRFSDVDAASADDGLAVDDFSITPNPAGGGQPTLSINDVAVTEGDVGTVTATFTVSLTAPAGAGGVTFDIATADNTATTADSDYVARALVGQTIPAGSSTYTFDVTVNGDTNIEANETFFVNVTNVTGATVGDAQGQGTINNDDAALIPINDIQGPGASSPLVGSTVTTRGIVTGRKSNGFFMQEPDATADANPLTSEGIFVFTAGVPAATIVVGDLVQVAGTVVEFVPSQDPLQPPLTELTFVTVTELSAGNPLPAPVPFTLAFPSAAGAFDQLERVEGMRVSVASATANGPTGGNVSEPNATATSNGIFHAVVTGNARAFREPGIEAPNPPPQGTIPPIPRWDSNPELFAVESDGAGGTQLNVNSGATVLNLVGPLDYGFRRYTIYQDAATVPTFSGGQTPTAVTVPTAQELTIASYNLERFFDTVNDPGIGEPVLTPAAFEMRLNKASIGIRNFLRTPDILGVVEVENLSTLQSLATRINDDAVAAGQPNPLYTARLVEGNDVGGIDVGFLIKQAIVAGTTPRVTINAVVQENAGELFVNADASTELLNDRPSLRLDAVVNNSAGATFPVTVIVNHLRSLIGVDSLAVGSNGWATAGERVRAKRQKQAESLANLVQARQTTNPLERIVLIGDFNAFEFNDGLVDSIGVIEGMPSPNDQTAVPGDGIDLVNPDLTALLEAVPAQRYSFIFGGNAQSLDHVLVNQAMLTATSSERAEHPRINADFNALERNNATTPSRLSDHDPVVAFFGVAGFAIADLSLTKTDSPDPVVPGNTITYTITATNAGPDAAVNATMTDTFSLGFTVESATGPAGWTCTIFTMTGQSTVSCANPSFAPGSAVFTIVVRTPTTATGTITNTATITSNTSDPNAANNSATATTAVTATANLSITKTDAPDPVLAGGNITYTLTAGNAGPSAATSTAVTDTLPAGTTFVSLASPAGWACTTPAVGAGGVVSCTNPSFASAGNAVFTLVVQVASGTAMGTVISNTAAISSTASDPVMGNNTATATTTVNAPVVITGTKTATGPFAPGSVFTYTVVLRNNSGGNQLDNPGDEFTDVLPAPLELVSASATSGTAVATVATRTVTWNGAIPAGGTVTITITARIPATTPEATVISNQGTFRFDADANGTNESSGVTDNPGTPAGGDATTFAVGGGVGTAVGVPTLSPALLAFLALMLGMVGMRASARRH